MEIRKVPIILNLFIKSLPTVKISAAGSSAKAMGANVKLAEAMGSTAKTMGQMNRMVNPTDVARTMQVNKHT